MAHVDETIGVEELWSALCWRVEKTKFFSSSEVSAGERGRAGGLCVPFVPSPYFSRPVCVLICPVFGVDDFDTRRGGRSRKGDQRDGTKKEKFGGGVTWVTRGQNETLNPNTP